MADLPTGSSFADQARAALQAEGAAGTGKALFPLASMINHDCEPCLDVHFPSGSEPAFSACLANGASRSLLVASRLPGPGCGGRRRIDVCMCAMCIF